MAPSSTPVAPPDLTTATAAVSTQQQPTGERHSSDGLVLAAVLTLPLTQALTVDIGFPLKISELLIAASIPLRLASQKRGRTRFDDALPVWSVVFLAATAASLVYALTFSRSRPPDYGLYRIGPAADGLLQFGYLVLAVATMFLISDLVRRRALDVLRWWLRAAILASLYALYLNLGSVLGRSFPLLPNTSQQLAHVGSLEVFRAGTFLEGNFFGLYLLISFILATIAGRRRTALLVSLAMLLSLSTLNILGMLGIWLIVAANDIRRRRRAAIGMAALLVMLLLTLPGSIRSSVGDKLRNPSSQSSLERRGSAAAALEMFRDKPVAGVGLGQYALWFPEYRPAFVPSEFLSLGRRQIANNVYAQLAAELGLLGLLPFVFLLANVLRALRRAKSRVLLIGFAAVLVVLNTFPSATVLFLWAFFGVCRGLGHQIGSEPTTTPAPRFIRPR